MAFLNKILTGLATIIFVACQMVFSSNNAAGIALFFLGCLISSVSLTMKLYRSFFNSENKLRNAIVVLIVLVLSSGGICVVWQRSLVSYNPKSSVRYEIPEYEQIETELLDVQKPLLTRTFWLLREPGSSIILGPCPGNRCIKFVLGDIIHKDSALVQKVFVEASFLRFKQLRQYKDVKFLDYGLHSKGCVLAHEISGDKIWFEIALSKDAICEVISKVFNITITVMDTRADSLRIKLQVLPGFGATRPYPYNLLDEALKDAKDPLHSNKLDEDAFLAQLKPGWKKSEQLADEGDFEAALVEINNLLNSVSRQQYPIIFWRLKLNEGYCYLSIGIKNKQADNIKKSVGIFETIKDGLVGKGSKKDLAYLYANQSTAYIRLSEYESEKENLLKAKDAIECALKAFDEIGDQRIKLQLYSNHDKVVSRLNDLEGGN